MFASKNVRAGARHLAAACIVLSAAAFGGASALAKVPTADIGKNHIKLEVAATPEQIRRGLMYRTAMPEDHGMVFIFRPTNSVKFWMAHCFIPLDMMMVRDGKIVKIFENVPPERDKPEQECPTYPSASEAPIAVTEVVEVNGGYAKRHGVKEGDEVHFSLDGRAFAGGEPRGAEGTAAKQPAAAKPEADGK